MKRQTPAFLYLTAGCILFIAAVLAYLYSPFYISPGGVMDRWQGFPFTKAIIYAYFIGLIGAFASAFRGERPRLLSVAAPIIYLLPPALVAFWFVAGLSDIKG